MLNVLQEIKKIQCFKTIWARNFSDTGLHIYTFGPHSDTNMKISCSFKSANALEKIIPVCLVLKSFIEKKNNNNKWEDNLLNLFYGKHNENIWFYISAIIQIIKLDELFVVNRLAVNYTKFM